MKQLLASIATLAIMAALFYYIGFIALIIGLFIHVTFWYADMLVQEIIQALKK